MNTSKISKLAHMLSISWGVLSLDIVPTGLLCIYSGKAGIENDKSETNNL